MSDAAVLRRDIRVAKRHAQPSQPRKAKGAPPGLNPPGQVSAPSAASAAGRIRRTKTTPAGSGRGTLSSLKRDVLQHRAAAAGNDPAAITRTTDPRSVPVPLPLHTPHSDQQAGAAVSASDPPAAAETAAVGPGQEPPLEGLVLQLLSAALVLQLKRAHMPELVAAAAGGAVLHTPLPAKAGKRGGQRPRKPTGPAAKALPAAGAPRVLVFGLRECAREVRLGRAKAVFVPLASWPAAPVLLSLQHLKAACLDSKVPFVQAGSKRGFSKALAIKGRATAVALLCTQALQGLPYKVLEAWERSAQPDMVGRPDTPQESSAEEVAP